MFKKILTYWLTAISFSFLWVLFSDLFLRNLGTSVLWVLFIPFISAISYSYSAWLEIYWQPKSRRLIPTASSGDQKLSFEKESEITSVLITNIIQEGDRYHTLSAKQVSQLELSLRRGIFYRFRDFWQGSSPRIDQFGRWVILSTQHLDSLLTEAAELAQIPALESYLPGEDLIIWLNPGQVKVTVTQNLPAFLSGSLATDAKGFTPLSVAGDVIYFDLVKYWHWLLRDKEKRRLGWETLLACTVVGFCLFFLANTSSRLV